MNHSRAEAENAIMAAAAALAAFEHLCSQTGRKFIRLEDLSLLSCIERQQMAIAKGLRYVEAGNLAETRNHQQEAPPAYSEVDHGSMATIATKFEINNHNCNSSPPHSFSVVERASDEPDYNEKCAANTCKKYEQDVRICTMCLPWFHCEIPLEARSSPRSTSQTIKSILQLTNSQYHHIRIAAIKDGCENLEPWRIDVNKNIAEHEFLDVLCTKLPKRKMFKIDVKFGRRKKTRKASNCPADCVCSRSEDVTKRHVLACEHVWGESCPTRNFELASQSEDNWPPKYCRSIPKELLLQVPPKTHKSAYQQIAEEWCIPSSEWVRCSNVTCRKTIRATVAKDLVKCQHCNKKTCIYCKRKSHKKDQDCRLHPSMQLSKREGLHKCPNVDCQMWLQCEGNCMKLKCRCGIKFCWKCCLRPARCQCIEDDEYLRDHESTQIASEKEYLLREALHDRKLAIRAAIVTCVTGKISEEVRTLDQYSKQLATLHKAISLQTKYKDLTKHLETVHQQQIKRMNHRNLTAINLAEERYQAAQGQRSLPPSISIADQTQICENWEQFLDHAATDHGEGACTDESQKQKGDYFYESQIVTDVEVENYIHEKKHIPAGLVQNINNTINIHQEVSRYAQRPALSLDLRWSATREAFRRLELARWNYECDKKWMIVLYEKQRAILKQLETWEWQTEFKEEIVDFLIDSISQDEEKYV